MGTGSVLMILFNWQRSLCWATVIVILLINSYAFEYSLKIKSRFNVLIISMFQKNTLKTVWCCSQSNKMNLFQKLAFNWRHRVINSKLKAYLNFYWMENPLSQPRLYRSLSSNKDNASTHEISWVSSPDRQIELGRELICRLKRIKKI